MKPLGPIGVAGFLCVVCGAPPREGVCVQCTAEFLDLTHVRGTFMSPAAEISFHARANADSWGLWGKRAVVLTVIGFASDHRPVSGQWA